jgi:AsmA protein
MKSSGHVDFSGRVNRDQRDLALNFSAVQGGDYPHSEGRHSQLTGSCAAPSCPLTALAARAVCRPAGRKMKKLLR